MLCHAGDRVVSPNAQTTNIGPPSLPLLFHGGLPSGKLGTRQVQLARGQAMLLDRQLLENKCKLEMGDNLLLCKGIRTLG